MFKVVVTLDSNNEKSFCAVPSQWEENGIIYWPPKDLLCKVRCNPHSVPNKNEWEAEECLVKMNNIITFREACHLEEQLVNLENTEAEEE